MAFDEDYDNSYSNVCFTTKEEMKEKLKVKLSNIEILFSFKLKFNNKYLYFKKQHNLKLMNNLFLRDIVSVH